MAHPQEHYTVADAADYCGLTTDAIRARIKRNEIPFVRVGSRMFILRESLEQFMRGQFVAGK